jgi:hypothetical protein
MIKTMKNLISSVILGVLAFAFVFMFGSVDQAHAQFNHNQQIGCPTASLYYPNGYSNNYCMPSYYPAPVVTTNYSYGNGYGNGYGGYNHGNYYISNNPFVPIANNAFYPYAAAPTYYYPPVRHYGQPW